MNKILWLYNRLKAMSISEIFYRVKQKIVHKINKIKFSNSNKIYEYVECNIDTEKLYSNLDKVFNNVQINIDQDSYEFKQFNNTINLNEKINWHKGIKGEWDKEISSYEIEFKNTDSIGDIRYSWEVNRHQFMPSLAIKYLRTKDKKYLNLLEMHFEDWMDNNRFLKGINWSSSMEIALRAYQWLIVLYFLKDSDFKEFKDKLAKSIIGSTDYVMKNLSLYSSANNHLILEVAISSIIGYCFKNTYNQDWFEKGYKVLCEELSNQFHQDGVNKEQALHYQGFVTDMMLQYNSIMKKIGFNEIESDLIKKSVLFINELNAQNNYVDFGDSDDAKIINFTNSKYNYYDYILTFASYHYGIDFSISNNSYLEVEMFCSRKKDLEKIQKREFSIYENGGYAIINNNDNVLVFDFGELGFGSLSAHGHADALMFMYYNKGNQFFIDSGTYIYNIERERRDYYRGTKAHNTLSYKDINQSEIKGPFLWGKKSTTKILNIEETDREYILEANNNGYNPNGHTRKIQYLKETDLIMIYDYFDKEAELNFILDDNVKVNKISENILRLYNNKEIFIYCDGNIELEKVNISKEFLQQIESNKIVVKYEFTKEHLTIISPDFEVLLEFLKERKKIYENS